mmetsp:Transcript_23784/g.37635  ORF Transcript_23784/g.37635 Transcript_23784/m.37635 type:complete len:224 (+) Transcript_23784:146-817(+)
MAEDGKSSLLSQGFSVLSSSTLGGWNFGIGPGPLVHMSAAEIALGSLCMGDIEPAKDENGDKGVSLAPTSTPIEFAAGEKKCLNGLGDHIERCCAMLAGSRLEGCIGVRLSLRKEGETASMYGSMYPAPGVIAELTPFLLGIGEGVGDEVSLPQSNSFSKFGVKTEGLVRLVASNVALGSRVGRLPLLLASVFLLGCWARGGFPIISSSSIFIAPKRDNQKVY